MCRAESEFKVLVRRLIHKAETENVRRLEGKLLPKMRLVVTPYDQCAVTPREETRLCADAQLETIQVLP